MSKWFLLIYHSQQCDLRARKVLAYVSLNFSCLRYLVLFFKMESIIKVCEAISYKFSKKKAKFKNVLHIYSLTSKHILLCVLLYIRVTHSIWINFTDLLKISCIHRIHLKFVFQAKEKFDGSESHKILEPTDIANAVVYAVSQPEYVGVNEILIEPREAPIWARQTQCLSW